MSIRSTNRNGRSVAPRNAVRVPVGTLDVSTSSANDQRLALAEEAGPFGILDIDRARGTLFCSDGWKKMLGFGPGESPTSGRTFLDLVHPDDIAAAMKLLEGHYVGATDTFQAEVRMRHRDGTYRWMLSRGRAVRDAQGTPVRMVGYQADISQTKALEEQLRIALAEAHDAEQRFQAGEDRFRTIFSSVNDAIIVCDPVTGKFTDVNRAACEMHGYTYDELVGADIAFISADVPPYTMTEAFDLLKRAMTEGTQSFEWRDKAKDGRLFWTEVSLRVAHFGSQDVVFSVVRDIDERKSAQQHVDHMAHYDGLTDLPNRATFLNAVENAIARTKRGARGFAIMSFDLDHFKDVNDTLGHPAGDIVLKTVADRIRASVRSIDMPARFGGDEFAVLATDIQHPGDVAFVAERLLKVLREPIEINGTAIQPGASFGIDLYSPAALVSETLLANADHALYWAKADGRGTYRFFNPADQDAADAVVSARSVYKPSPATSDDSTLRGSVETAR